MSLVRGGRRLKSVLGAAKGSVRTQGIRNVTNWNENVSMYPVETEYTDTPQYPPIVDNSFKAKLERKTQEWVDQVKDVWTVEQKIFKLNMPKYYGWRSLMFRPEQFTRSLLYGLPFAQMITKTHLAKEPGIDRFYPEHRVAATSLAGRLSSAIQDTILAQHENIQRNIEYKVDNSSNRASDERQKNKIIGKHILKQINRIILNSIAQNLPHLSDAQVDIDPRFEAFWFASLPAKPTEQQPFDRLNHSIQYIDEPVLTLRHNLPLEPLVPYSEADNPEFDIPEYKHNVQSLTMFTERRHVTLMPGYWPGDEQEFGLLSFHNRDFMVDRPKNFGPEDAKEIMHLYGIIASFGWLNAQAAYQGFTSFNDITYPLTTQTVISDGQHWSFYAYQLNTMILYKEVYAQNKKSNLCFYTDPMKLYEGIEGGRIIGFNEDVLATLIQMYLNTPRERTGVEMKPYLNPTSSKISEIEFEEKRLWTEDQYKYLVANRPRQKLDPEIHMWERIYKIKFNTRPFEARRRPFELGVDPYKRRLDERSPTYISRYERPGGYMDKRRKFVRSFYP